MREIKFRGRDVFTKEWRYGDLIHYQKVTYTGWTSRIMVDGYEVDENTVGQFTDLRDKNGVEIYEGDIVLNSCNGDYITIRWNKVWCGYTELYYDLQLAYEVVGNIYDKKEEKK